MDSNFKSQINMDRLREEGTRAGALIAQQALASLDKQIAERLGQTLYSASIRNDDELAAFKGALWHAFEMALSDVRAPAEVAA